MPEVTQPVSASDGLYLTTKPCDDLGVTPNPGYLDHADDHHVSPFLCVLIPTIVLRQVEHALNNV